MHDFIVRKRQDEILVVMIQHREREIVLVIFAVDGFVAEIVQRVVHPTHVPFEGETEAAEIGRARDLRPRGGFLGHGDDAGKLHVCDVVERAQKFDGFEILAATVLVGNPFVVLARVIQIEHRSHGIHAQAVHVKLFAPKERVGGEEIDNLMPAEIENQRAPILVRAFARIGVLVKRGAIEIRERPFVARGNMQPEPNR